MREYISIKNSDYALNGLNKFLAPLYRFCVKILVHIIYDIKIKDFNKIPLDRPILIISNHISYIDGIIISIAMKRHVRFVIDANIYNLPVVNYFMSLDKAIPIYPKRDSVYEALREVASCLNNGGAVGIFPEGQITYSGYLQHFRPGVEWILKRAPVEVVPIYLDGLWGSIFSRKYIKSRWRFIPRALRRKITVIAGDPISPENINIDDLHLAVLNLRNRH